MRLKSLAGWAAVGMLFWGLVTGYFALPLAAQTAEQLAFIPSGGRTLLAEIAASKPAPAELDALTTGKHTREAWLSDLNTRRQAVPALQSLSDKQRLTLADYLSFHMPLPGTHAPVNLASALPKDGRDLALEHCQGCHIITVVVTQVRTKTAWLGTLSTPSHAVIKMTQAERDELASYLEIDAGIPIEEVPEELRASGATY